VASWVSCGSARTTRAGLEKDTKLSTTLKRFLQVAGLLLLVWLAWERVDFEHLGATLGGVTPVAAVALLVVATVDRWIMALKWRHLANAIGLRLGTAEFVSAYYASSFLSYFLPTTLGGEIYRGYRISRRTRDPARVAASMVAEKMVSVLATVVIAWLGLGYLIGTRVAPESMSVFGVLLLVSVGVFVAFSVSMNPRLHAPFLKLSQRWQKLASPLTKLSTAYTSYSGQLGVLAANFLLALFENSLQLAILTGAALAIGIPVDPIAFVAIASVSQFLMRLSMVFDGWGISEAVRILTYGLVGVTATDAFAVALVGHAAVAIASLPGAFVFFRDPARKTTGAPKTPAPEGSES